MKQSLNLPLLSPSLTNLTFACGTDIMPKRDITPNKIHFEYFMYIASQFIKFTSSFTNLTFTCGTDIMPKRDITPIKIHFECLVYIASQFIKFTSSFTLTH